MKARNEFQNHPLPPVSGALISIKQIIIIFYIKVSTGQIVKKIEIIPAKKNCMAAG